MAYPILVYSIYIKQYNIITIIRLNTIIITRLKRYIIILWHQDI